MTPVTVTSRVGPDGVLHVDIPIGAAQANREVKVTIEPLADRPQETPEEYRAWVRSMAGSWQGDFERPEQGEFETRDPLP